MNNPIVFFVSLLACLYSISYLSRRFRYADLAAPHSLYTALAFLHFFLPGLLVGSGLAPDFVTSINSDYALMAVLFAFAGLIFVQTGSSFATNVRCKTVLTPPIEIRWRAIRILLVTIVLLVLGWITRLYVIVNHAYLQYDRSTPGELEGPFYAALRMIELFPSYVICLLSIRYWRPGEHISYSWRNALYATVISELLYWLPSGRKEPIILAIALPLIIRYLQSNRLPSWHTVSAFVTFFVFLFPLAFFYRYALEVGGGTGDIADITRAVSEAFMSDSGGGKTPTEIIFGRLSLLEPLGACIRIWEHKIWEPMMGGSYAQALLGFIPRFIWPEKPDIHYGNDFGYVAGFISSDDIRTSISVTFFGEAYLNFGFGGLVPLTIMGFLFGVPYKNINASKRRETWLLVYSVMIPTILYVGGTFALYFGGLIKLLPFFYLVGRFMENPLAHASQLFKASRANGA